jgi:serine protease Do
MVHKKFIQGIVGGVGIACFIFFAQSGTGAITKLNPIKPAANQTSVLTDEQQAILAVRTGKASVVSITGSSAIVPSDTATLSPTDKIDNSYGSGFIVDSSGYIVSNSHVVNDSQAEYTVIFADNSKFKAKVVGLDTYSDIALLKIEKTGLPAARLGNSDALETGQTVFAIGNTLGRYQNTVTKGVVSGLGRDVSLDSITPRPRLQNLIQTDAAISPGNSGGPLINLAGEVVGMNTLIDTEGYSLSFAIPINVIKEAVNELKTLGKVSRPYLGVSYQTINNNVRVSRKLETNAEGAFVLSVSAGSPAAIHLKRNDIIVSINKEKLTEFNELDKVIQRYKAGNQILLEILRDGKKVELPLILSEYR